MSVGSGGLSASGADATPHALRVRATSSLWATHGLHAHSGEGALRRLAIELIELGLAVGLQELVDEHEAAANANDELVVLHFGEDFALAEHVLAVAEALEWHVEIEVVDVGGHFLVNAVALDRDVLEALLWSVSHFLLFASAALLFFGLEAGLFFGHGLDLILQFSDSYIFALQIVVYVLVFHISILEFLLELCNTIFSLSDFFFLFLNGRESILLLHHDIHADSLLLVDVSVPDLDCEFLLGNLLLVVDGLVVTVG